MDFLTLVKRLATESGTELESRITSVVTPPAAGYGETTEHRSRLVNWVKQAWLEIQEDQDQWDFMVRRATMPVVRGQVIYDVASLAIPNCEGKPIEECDPENAYYDHIVPFVAPRDRRYIWVVDGDAEKPTPQFCYYTPPEVFFGNTDRYNNRTFGQPTRYSIDRDGCLVLNVSPSDDRYYLEFEYKMLPCELTEDADVPRGLPNKFHMLIIYKALVYYSMFDEADKQVQRAMKLYRDWLNKLRLAQLKEYSIPGGRS